ncbi:T9SS type A sorting domain-containing protein [Runella sp. MFBS21]|uniref:T9SS type A sorting domain-containing protein n=1 Tax=Runella sp. MFBS21 TaxID=3034018 RepID=UPI0023F99B52|nr:T9SS type A sorting domain-containing protein [Runella sp. MFBS21]MDF7821877.1 T9SS type A sorting domain-containing protein [Runella sp. MFBS21]
MIANLQQSYMIAFFLIGSVLFGAKTSVIQSPAPYILSANPYSTDIYTVPSGGPYRTKIAAKSAQEGITVGRAGAVMIGAPGGKGSLLGGGAGNGKGSSGQVVIEYVGRATPNLSINLTSTWEGNAGNTIYTFSVTLSEPAPAGGVSFDIATADNTATTADNDYTAKSLTSQTIPEGNSTYTFTVSVNGDLKFKPDESFFVNITNVTGANVRDAQGIGIIANDDADCSSSTVTTGTTFCNEGGITINDNGVATPYPSCISVSGLTGTIQKVTITLKNLTHTAPDDIDLLLYSPTGQKYVFMSDVGGTNAVTNLDLIFDSSASSALPDNTTLVSGTFRPTDFEVDTDVFPAPAPAGPYYSASTTSLGTLLNNSNPNGTWYLYAVDDAATNTGSIGGWCLNFTMSCPTPTLYVNQAIASSGDGTSWANAFKTLQEALSAANACSNITQIWVAAGTYHPTADASGSLSPADPRTKTFVMKNNLAIYGGFAGNEIALADRVLTLIHTTNKTTLSGDIDQNNTLDNGNSYHVVYNKFTSGATLTNTAILNGFTITAGNANGSNDNVGGGMYNEFSSPTVTNCNFLGNYGLLYGGGMYNPTSCSPILTNCAFIGNSTSGSGGGMHNLNYANPTLTNCIFFGNKADGFGGGMHNYSSFPTLKNCSFSGNYGNPGGGISNWASNPSLTNCILWGNNSQIENLSSSSPTYTKTIVQGMTVGGFEGTENPRFVTQPDFSAAPTSTGNLRLLACSPALNAGSDADNNTTADLDFNARKFGVIDLGAYESQSDPVVITINAPSVTQPTCATPTGTVVVNATGTGTLEYSINNGTDWQVGSTFSGLSAGDYNIKVRTQGSPSCETSYGSNPVVLSSPPNVTAGTLSSNVESICQGGSVDMTQVGQTGTSTFFIFQNNVAIVSYASLEEVEAFFFTAAPNQYCVYTIAYLGLNNGCGNVAGFTLAQIIDACLDEQCYDISEPVCITVAANNTDGAASSTPTVCINTSLTSITHTTTGATGIGTATGLPSGVSAAWASNMLTISGTPTEVGIFTYSIPLTGGCGNVNATGTITVNPLPTATISGGGTVCQNATSRSITFTGAAGTAPYTFTYKVNNGTDQTVATTNGNSVDVNQSTNNTGGYIYTLVSVKDGSLTQCSQTQGGTATVTVNAQPVAPSLNTKTPNVSTICIGTAVSAAFTAGSGGVGCSDDFIVIIDGGSPVAYTAGTLVGSTATSSVVIKGRRANCGDVSCMGTEYMTLAEWGVITSLANFTLSSATALCLSGGGNVPNATLSLSGSQLGVSYQLHKNGNPIGNSLLGTGSKLSFVVPMSVGSYTVVGTIECNNVSGSMSGTVVMGSQPTAYSVSGGGSYCSGGTGVAVGLSASQVGVNYQLRRSNVNMGDVVAGTGNALSFGNQTTVGTYTVVGIEALSGCSRTMSGSKTVTLSNCAGREGVEKVSNADGLLEGDWVSLYPNPIIKERAELMIQGQSGKEVEWRLLSAGGQELSSHKLKMKESVERVGISLQGVSAGAYLIQVIVDDKRATLKVVKSE